MKIIYKKGNMLSGPEIYIGHGCNARGVMGSGVALQIKKKWPNVYSDYKKVYDEEEERLVLGTVITSVTPDNCVVFNCITQADYGREEGKVYVSYKAIEQCMQKINTLVPLNSGTHVAFPQIGAGLGNGDWSIIEHIIESASTNFQPVVHVL